MLDRPALLALAARVEREAPSVELRNEIALALGWTLRPGAACWVRPASLDSQSWLPEWLTSIDAAAHLMPDGWHVSEILQVYTVSDELKWGCRLAKRIGPPARGDAPTEPQARTAAALRAMAEGGA